MAKWYLYEAAPYTTSKLVAKYDTYDEARQAMHDLIVANGNHYFVETDEYEEL